MAEPVGCFCWRIPSKDGACSVCTCPDCGAYGRYGEPILHKPHCV